MQDAHASARARTHTHTHTHARARAHTHTRTITHSESTVSVCLSLNGYGFEIAAEPLNMSLPPLTNPHPNPPTMTHTQSDLSGFSFFFAGVSSGRYMCLLFFLLFFFLVAFHRIQKLQSRCKNNWMGPWKYVKTRSEFSPGKRFLFFSPYVYNWINPVASWLRTVPVIITYTAGWPLKRACLSFPLKTIKTHKRLQTT